MPLTVSKVSKRFDRRWALKDVSFEVERGEIFGLFGTTGSGKSTLLNIIAGAVEPNGGSIQFDSAQIGPNDAKRWLLHSGRSDHISGWKRLFFAKAQSAAAPDRIKTAAASASNVLLLDDPFAAMDPIERLDTIRFLRKTAVENGIVVIVATSDFDEILLFCDKAAVLDGSEIIQTGTPQSIYLEPASSVVARITGRNNLFRARRLTSSKAEIPQFQTLEGSHKLTVGKTPRGLLGSLNQDVSLGIRPESICLSFGASFPEDNLLRSVVADVRFLGPSTLVGLDANGLRLEALVPRLVGLERGDDCMIGLPPDRIAVYKDQIAIV